MIVLDTTVLVYALGADHPLRNRATDLLAAIAEGRLRGTTTPEVIQEFAHVRARRRGRQDAAGAAATFADLLSPLVEVGEGDLREGLRLLEGNPGLAVFDAVLAAAARRAGARALVSADRAFGAVDGLAWQDLRSADAAALD